MRAWYHWVRAHIWGLAVGAIVTMATAEAFWAGHVEWLSMFLLDVQFKHCSRVVADNRVVMIDINDYALERVHKWPWPREFHADLVDTLSDLGAQAVLMDLVFASPEAGRIVHPKLNPDYEIDDVVEIIGDTGDTVDVRSATWDDEVFAGALKRAGNVCIAMFARLYGPRFFPDAIRATVYAILKDDPDIEFEAFQERLSRRLGTDLERVMSTAGRSAVRNDPRDLFDLLRMEYVLESSFGTTGAELAAMLGLGKKQVETHLAAAKRDVARRLVTRYRQTHPDASWLEMLSAILPDQRIDLINADRKDLIWALRAVRSESYVLDSAVDVPRSLLHRIRNASDLTLPYYKLAGAAEVGLVSFETDEVDGVMRRVALMVNARGKLLKHLGFALACDVLDVDDGTIRIEEGNLLVMRNRRGDRQWRIPIDDEGRTLINWHIDPGNPKWQHSFEHIPVTRLMEIPRLRSLIAEDEARRVFHLAEIVRFRFGETVAGYARYAESVRRCKALREMERTVEQRAELETLQADIAGTEDESVAIIREWTDEILADFDTPDALAELDSDTRRMMELAQTHDAVMAKIDRLIRSKRKRIAEANIELRSLIQGKICLVGYTATAVADTVNTPVFDEVPGVMAHANVINSMLLNLFPRSPSRGMIVLLILFMGMVITVITSWRDPWVSLFSMGLCVAVLAGVASSCFYAFALYIDIVGPLLAVFLSWTFVTLYRQLIEARQKRAFSKSLAQYTSPAIAAKLADQLTRKAGTLDLAPQACEVTCYFSDLKGFTSISERLGASRTRDVLNPYLEAMSDVLIKSDAMINKFMGDGIFAFFNPPIHPVENHARAGCEAALESFVALDRLKEELGHGELKDEVRAFSMRVGVNTGEVFVGDYGSSSKLDYTCIGDTVNLSARLEPACKPFGISAMVSEATLTSAGDGYVVRHLGGLQVVGKREAVQVYELIGRRSEVDDAVLEYAELFGQAVAHFQNRRWREALGVLASCRKARPLDRAIMVLEENIRIHQATPPPDDWNQAIELTSK